MVDKRLVKLRVHSGERISSIKGNPGDHLVLLITIAMEMLLDNELNQSRASAMASIIHTFSIYTFRNGDKGLAKLGFTLAETLSGHYDYQERKWVKILAQIIPPIHVERLLRIGRILFRR